MTLAKIFAFCHTYIRKMFRASFNRWSVLNWHIR